MTSQTSVRALGFWFDSSQMCSVLQILLGILTAKIVFFINGNENCKLNCLQVEIKGYIRKYWVSSRFSRKFRDGHVGCGSLCSSS